MFNIAIRTDSSSLIGSGHVMRCLTLSKAIQKKNDVNIFFFTRPLEGNSNNEIISSGFKVLSMPIQLGQEKKPHHSKWLGATEQQDAQEFLHLMEKNNLHEFDLIITDNYGIGKNWHRKIRQKTKKILVIDDLAEHPHLCDYLLDQTYNCTLQKYAKLVPSECLLLLGTPFALLRDEFLHINKPKCRKNSLLLMFGGGDSNNLTVRALKQVIKRLDITEINVVLSSAALHLQAVKEYIRTQRFNTVKVKLHISPNNIAQLMQTSLLAIGAAGTTSWERCASGLPSVVIIQAENQRKIAEELSNAEVISYLEESEIELNLNKQISQWLDNKERYDIAVQKGLEICDAKGSYRVVDCILKGNIDEKRTHRN